MSTFMVNLWDSLGPSPALALSHVTARVTVPYRTVQWTVSHVCLNWTTSHVSLNWTTYMGV